MVSRKALHCLSASLLAFVPVAAHAQSDPSTAAPGSAPAEKSTTSPQGPAAVGQSDSAQDPAAQSGLADIIVTAQQRGESLQKAAVPVAVVSGSDLINAGVGGIQALGRLVPSVVIPGGSQGNLIFIRGVGNFSFTPNSDPAAAYNFDGVYVGRSSSTFGAFYDLERVEVLKGPQGTLYGRNATAGAINIIPVQPRIGQTSAYATGSYGNYDAVAVEAAINLALGDNAAFRFSSNISRHDGYLRDGTQGADERGMRAQLKVDLTDNLTVRIEADYARQGSSGSGTSYFGKYALNAATGQFTITPSGLPLSEGLFTNAAQNYRVTNGLAGTVRAAGRLGLLPYLNNTVYGVGYHLDWKTPIGTVSVVPAWRHGRKDNLSTDSAQQIGTVQDSNQYSIETRLVSDPGRFLDYIVGAYYFSEELKDDLHTGAGIQNGYTLSNYKTRSPSAYVRLTAHVTDWLRLTGGARYTEDRKSFASQTVTLAVACTIATGCPTAPLLPYTTSLAQQPLIPATSGARIPLGTSGALLARSDVAGSGSLKTTKTTYRAAVEVDLASQSLLYASVETGYRAGGFNTAFNYAPENIRAFTLGSKNRFFGNRIQLNLEAFDWKYRGQQLSYLGIDPLGRVGVITQNIGRSSIRGFEVEGRALVTPTTTLSANLQYLDAEYKSFTYTSPARPFTACAVTQPAATAFVVDCSGRPAINSPKWTVNFGAEQRIPIGDLELSIAADTQYRSGRFVGFEYIAPEYVSGTWASNAQISIGAPDGRYVVSAFVRNIENNRVPSYATPVPASNLIVTLPGAPRTYGVRLSTKF